jgi:hypothetical protein
MSASSLAVVKAARGGLEGGESHRSLWRTSGKPLCPYIWIDVSVYSNNSQGWIDAAGWTKKRTAGPGSGVMETSQIHGRVDDVATGEDVGLRTHNLAIAITTGTLIVVSTGSHC